MESDTGLDGFLTENLPFETEVSRTNGMAFNLARRINRECHSLIFNNAEVRNRDGQSMLVAALFLRVLQFQAGILLLGKGLVASGKVAIRAELEAVFAVRAIAANEANFRAFVNDDLRERLDLIKKARKYDYPILLRLREAISDEDFAQLKKQVEGAGATKKVTTAALSEQAELHHLYVSAYSILSRAAHSGVRELDAHLIVGPNGEVQEIDYAPELDGVKDMLLTACDFILLGSDAVCHQFEISSFADMRRELSKVMADMESSRQDPQ
ncbi:DUF5677 domain-containing protein [Mesorhizobium kowhaii]|uniref:Uncharacterized protein n=1 Tax=Mesorhizobium kowhaii TaxID=1300272 RepID=A0A2W7C5H9_9HYPH|nr:DUF5677 domain-containing protein [Mesorhizobium kowhaii]PZV37078.1 hypothetical protein B5V02_18630 [Mesorhizobium kowhaii]